MSKFAPILLFSSVLVLAACDEVDSDLERAAIGAAIGCAAGQVLVNGRCVEGAVVGGAAGALSDEF
ncbi:MAG: hypothetical protein AAF718_12085 [Pseudomonadota bacterium]